MAKETIFVDDLTGQHGATPTSFPAEGTIYDIDLIPEHERELREIQAAHEEQLRRALAKFIQAGRARGKAAKPSAQKVTTARSGRGGRTGRNDPQLLKTVRKWAHAHGYEFSDEGRVPNHVWDAWDRIGPGSKAKRGQSIAEINNGGHGEEQLFSDRTAS